VFKAKMLREADGTAISQINFGAEIRNARGGDLKHLLNPTQVNGAEGRVRIEPDETKLE
jgi:hypothetical protein